MPAANMGEYSSRNLFYEISQSKLLSPAGPYHKCRQSLELTLFVSQVRKSFINTFSQILEKCRIFTHGSQPC